MALVAELIAYATQEQFVYRHKWRKQRLSDLERHVHDAHRDTLRRVEIRPPRISYMDEAFEVADSTSRDEEMMSHH